MSSRSLIVATAGHVDHGKTSLVKHLTGVDTDTLEEEKKRGLTINLGYAYSQFSSQAISCTLGFVDVPGHIDFINNMLAGFGAVNYALLVIAADDGVMPQTREHLSIIKLLGVKNGIVAITKIDKTTSIRIETLRHEIAELTKDSIFKSAEIFEISNTTKKGIEGLSQYLKSETLRLGSQPDSNESRNFRFLIDRAFGVKGIGTVVTGCVKSGSIKKDNHAIISRTAGSIKVKGIRIDKDETAAISLNQRAALNIDTGLENVSRGDWLLDHSILHPVTRLDANVILIDPETSLKTGTEYHLYIGAAHHVVSLRQLSENDVFFQITAQSAVIAHYGDRFILRDPASQHTIGGGKVIDLFVPRKKRSSEHRINELVASNQRDDLALKSLIETSPTGLNIKRFLINRNLKLQIVETFLKKLRTEKFEYVRLEEKTNRDLIILFGDFFRDYAKKIIALVKAFHSTNVNAQGISEQSLSREAQLPGSHLFFSCILQILIEKRLLSLTGTLLHLPDHKASLSVEEREFLSKVRPLLEKSGNIPPRTRELVDLTGIPLRKLEVILKQITRSGSLVKVAENRYFLPETIMELAEFTEKLVDEIHEQNGFTVIQFRDQSGIGRNLCIEILEYFDRVGFTKRDGNARYLRTEKENIFAKS